MPFTKEEVATLRQQKSEQLLQERFDALVKYIDEAMIDPDIKNNTFVILHGLNLKKIIFEALMDQTVVKEVQSLYVNFGWNVDIKLCGDWNYTTVTVREIAEDIFKGIK